MKVNKVPVGTWPEQSKLQLSPRSVITEPTPDMLKFQFACGAAISLNVAVTAVADSNVTVQDFDDAQSTPLPLQPTN